MKELENIKKRKKGMLFASFKTKAFRAGGYSVAAALIVLAIAVAANLLAEGLPERITKLDATPNQLFSISDQTKKLVGGITQDVTVYWIAQSGKENDTLRLLLDRYEALSSHVTVVKRDPDVYPGFLRQYELENATNNALVVESGTRFRYVDASEIFVVDYDSYYYTGEYSQSFDGERAITSAIDYVVKEAETKIYTLSGHGEFELPETFAKAVELENIQTDTLSLLTLELVPEDADAVLVIAPQSDISTREEELLNDYLKSGGSLFLITDPPQEGELTNLAELMAGYGVEAAQGVVVEGSQRNYAWGAPFYLLPEINSHDITDPLLENGYYVLLPVAQGIVETETRPGTVTVTELLTTSSSAISKVAGYELTTYEREDGDIDGPFALAVAVTDALSDGGESRVVWVSSSMLLDEETNLNVSGGNQDFFLNAIGWMCRHEDSDLSIHAKSLDYEYLTMDSGTTSLFKLLILGVLPLMYLSIGIVIYVRRKRA